MIVVFFLFTARCVDYSSAVEKSIKAPRNGGLNLKNKTKTSL